MVNMTLHMHLFALAALLSAQYQQVPDGAVCHTEWEGASALCQAMLWRAVASCQSQSSVQSGP